MSQAHDSVDNTHSFDPILVADIGGTNARFALATGYDALSHQFTISHISIFPSSDFETFEKAIAAFLDTISEYQISRACLAVAGPILGDDVSLTNLGWQFNVHNLKAQFGFDELKVINDFAAFAYAAPFLNTTDNVVIKEGNANPQGNVAVFGPGTGFGAASLVRAQGANSVLSCEAGHISLAAVTELDKDLIDALQAAHGHVSVETVFSGPGIANLYQAFAKIEGKDVESWDAAQIALAAAEQSCMLAEKTLDQFCDWIGSVAGDLALTFGARGGVYIGGGILPRMLPRLVQSEFNKRFVAKGIMSHFNEDIPVTLVCQDNIPFIGAAACISQG